MTIIEVLMDRDGLSLEEAKLELFNARQRILEREDPEEILLKVFGLEPDYIEELL